MSISTHMAALGAPLKNSRWSWGATREDGSVVLRVWQHYVKGRWVSVYRDVADNSLGRAERAAHLHDIRNGARAYAVMQLGVDNKSEKLLSFDNRTVFEITALREDPNGEVWAYLGNRIPAHQLMLEAEGE